jgi:hypothetical protein
MVLPRRRNGIRSRSIALWLRSIASSLRSFARSPRSLPLSSGVASGSIRNPRPSHLVSGVAAAYGFDDYTVVWNDPGNADLQQQRPDPHVLQAGDSLTIPEVKDAATANKPTGAKHQFSINAAQDPCQGARPRGQADDGGRRDHRRQPLTTDGTGLVEATVEKTATSVPMQDPDTTFSVWSVNTERRRLATASPTARATSALSASMEAAFASVPSKRPDTRTRTVSWVDGSTNGVGQL